MNEQDQETVGEIVEDLTGIPEPIKKSLFKAVGDLMEGLVSVPAAKLNQIAQGINDTTAAKTLISEEVSKVAAEKIINDADLINVATEAYLPTTVRKMRNRIKVAQSTTKHICETSPNADASQSEAPNENWMNNFMRYAEDASSEELQDMLGRLLAGQILRPGAFSLTTLRTISELDQELATDFLHAWSQNTGSGIDYNREWQIGDGFMRWQRLIEAGLLAPDTARQYLPEFTPAEDDLNLWSPMGVENTFLTAAFRESCKASWRHIGFTRVGREIGSLLPAPNYAQNIRLAVHRIDKVGFAWMRLYETGAEPEVIWQETP